MRRTVSEFYCCRDWYMLFCWGWVFVSGFEFGNYFWSWFCDSTTTVEAIIFCMCEVRYL